MILADTSAWVDFLRGTDHPASSALTDLLREEAHLAVAEVILMELLAGAGHASQLRELRVRLLGFPMLPLQGLADFEEAALIYRTCRAGGETITELTDCLIAAVAIRENAELLHVDADFDAIARHTALRIYPLSPS